MKNLGNYILGLDLGVASVGWAAVEFDEKNNNGRIIKTGVRVFEPGMNGDISAGRAETRNKARRDARQIRRQTRRRRQRMQKLYNRLQSLDFLPQGQPTEVFQKLDTELLAKHCPDGEDAARFAHILPYYLRKLALDEKLEPYEMGRALYHLAQRRGYNSNKKAEAIEDDKEKGAVESGIKNLQEKIAHSGARTLGEYFAGLDPEKDRIRTRWTSRQMFEDEFQAIVSSQQEYHPNLTREICKDLHKCIFHQRPLKSVAHLIGWCEREANQRRAPWARLEAQRYRLLQKLNDTTVIYPDPLNPPEPLSNDQKQVLKKELEKNGSIRFTQARKLLNLDKKIKFNWEEGGEKSFKGNTTSAKLFQVFGDRWFEMTENQRRAVVEDVHSIQKEETLEKRGREHWGLSDESAKAFSQTVLEPDYCRLSMKAIRKLLPLMEAGTPVSTAIKEVYGEFHKRSQLSEYLPVVQNHFPSLLNPVVNRTLTEMRKVVNAVVNELGVPARIHVELARDIKRSKKQRQEITKRNRNNETKRENARNAIMKEAGIPTPTRDDILKYQLAEECNWECPYTGRKITPRNLFGSHHEFDIEHIIPFSKSLDNSFLNKTLCHHEENRNRKGNKTPWQAYSYDKNKFDDILQRVNNFKSDVAKEKMRRFMLQEVGDLDEWASRQLNDTRYASKLAVSLLGTLYGGREDDTGKQRIFATSGQATAHVRNALNLNGILSDGPRKSRDDHRHHAVDALAVALTTPYIIRKLSTASQYLAPGRRTHAVKIDPPWHGFLSDVRESIDGINVSFKPKRKANGALHQETIYSPPREDDNGKQYAHLRVPLASMSTKDIDNIVDPAVREAVMQRLHQLGGNIKKFEEPENHPIGKNGHPIRKARVRRNVNVMPVGKGIKQRHALPGSNHHMEILECTKRGKTIWDAEVVTTFEAMQRLKAGEPLVCRDHGPDKKFICSITSGDMATIEVEGERKLIVLASVWEEQNGSKRIQYYYHTDARPGNNREKPKKSVSGLPQMCFQKVIVTPMGEILPAND